MPKELSAAPDQNSIFSSFSEQLSVFQALLFSSRMWILRSEALQPAVYCYMHRMQFLYEVDVMLMLWCWMCFYLMRLMWRYMQLEKVKSNKNHIIIQICMSGVALIENFCVNIAFFGCRTHFSHIAASPYAKWQHRSNKLCLTGGCRVIQH